MTTQEKKSHKTRRGRGEGTIRQRADGLWEARYNGKTRYAKTKREAQDKIFELRGLSAQGIDVSANSVGKFLEMWLSQVEPTVEPNTFGPYKRHCDLHLKPVIGATKLGKLTPQDVADLYSKLAKRGVSPALQRKVGTTLTIALNDAVRMRLLGSNPAALVRKPKAPKPEIRPLDLGEVKRFLEAAESDRLFALYVVGVDSGARPGELLALEWSDIDFEAGAIRITKALEEIGGHHRIKETKTAKSRRSIHCSAGTMAVLAQHRQRMKAEGHGAGPVFCNRIGGRVRISDLHFNSFKPILKRAGLRDCRLYDATRHTCATLLLLAEVNPKIVSERLGHSSITITLDTYSHVLPTMGKKVAETIGRLLPLNKKANQSEELTGLITAALRKISGS